MVIKKTPVENLETRGVSFLRMKSNNTLDKAEFLREHILWGVISFLWYRAILFRCLPFFTMVESVMILLMILALVSYIGIVLEYRRGRNGGTIATNLLLAFGIYTSLAYYQIRPRLILSCLLISSMLSVGCCVYILRQMASRAITNRRILKKRALLALLSVKKTVAMGVTAIMASFLINLFFGSAVIKAGAIAKVQEPVDEQTAISNSIETLKYITPSLWEDLSVQERLNVLQTVANIEQQTLGLPHELNVGASNLSHSNEGRYIEKTHEIIINIDDLLYGSPEDLLDTVCHEAYHSYQNCLVEAIQPNEGQYKDLKIFQTINTYKYENNNYISGKSNYNGYFAQACETDAREYAEEAKTRYYLQVELLLNNENGKPEI